MSETSKITIYDVAAEAGVSIGTVSKVLSNTAKVSQATRDRVLRATERLNYVPSLAARGIARGRTSIIGLLIPYTPAQVLNDPHLQGNISGIQEALNERDYTLLVATANKEHDPSTSYERLLRSRYLEGAVVMETQESQFSGLHRYLTEQDYPWVVLGYPVGNSGASYCVHSDDLQGAQRLTEHLLELGHRRIGVVNVRQPGPYGFEERLRGHQQTLRRYNLPFDESLLVIADDWTEQSGYRVAPQLFQRVAPPTAVFALNDRMALGIIQWAQEHGLDVPGKVSVVGFDDIPLAAHIRPALTTVRQNAVTMGRNAVNLLFQLLEGQNPPSRLVIATDLVLRQSSAPPLAS